MFDAHPGPALTGKPGTLLQRSRGAVLVRTGDGSVWIGHVRVRDRDQPKLPATMALGSLLGQLPEVADPVGYQEISYFRTGPVGVLSFDFYNGAMSTGQCERLAAAVRHAAAQDTRVLIIRGGEIFSNGIHLNVIEAAPSPSIEAWQNIKAIDDVCREIITCTRQLVLTSVGGNAGAGGVMLALGADEVLLHERRRAQPALPHDGPVRLGVLDLRAAPPGRAVPGRAAHHLLRADQCRRRRCRSVWPTRSSADHAVGVRGRGARSRAAHRHP